jgi:hypothetical protein
VFDVARMRIPARESPGGRARYHADGTATSWLKINNDSYSQMQGRREPFDARRDQRRRRHRRM